MLNDFDRDLEKGLDDMRSRRKLSREFDREFEKTKDRILKYQRFVVFAGIAGCIATICSAGFVMWVIVKIMGHYGIL